MANSKIEWTGKTWNPTTGCNKVSRGCRLCYAEVMHKRLMVMQPKKYSRPFLDGAFPHEESLPAPFQWKKPEMVFVDSMSDLFHENIPIDYIAKCYAVMFLNPHLTFQILTKRPERRKKLFKGNDFPFMVAKAAIDLWGKYNTPSVAYTHREIHDLFPFKNIWEGTSVESEKEKSRIDHLRDTEAHIRFLSCEPLVGPLGTINLQGIHWVIAGGESGPKAAPMHPEWAISLRDQCQAASVPFFFKQWGTWGKGAGKRRPKIKKYVVFNNGDCIPFSATNMDNYRIQNNVKHWDDVHPIGMAKVGKKLAGRLLDGVEHNGFPEIKLPSPKGEGLGVRPVPKIILSPIFFFHKFTRLML